MSSKRAARRRSCQGKRRHDDWNGANAALRSLLVRKVDHGHMQVYRCPACHGFHIGQAAPQ